MIDKQKYLLALKYETPDAVLGSIMSEIGFPKLNGIGDACDVANRTKNNQDLKTIQAVQPMFYNYQQHRIVNKNDVINILKHLK